MDAVTIFIQAMNGIQYGLLLFLVASGLTLIFGIMGVINIAHGSFYMIGAYLAWSFMGWIGNFWLGLFVGVVVAFVLGLVLEFLFIRFLYDKDHLQQVLVTYGLILIFSELRSVIWGDDVHSVAIPALLDGSIQLTENLAYPVYRIWLSSVCIVIAILMFLGIQHTRLGMMIRAGESDREMTKALGINIGLVYRFIFALGVSLAAFSGMISAPISSVFPGMGGQVLIVSFVVVVIGGLGSIKGAMVAALLVGLIDTFGKVTTLHIFGVNIFPEMAGMSIFALMALILMFRPQGIFGREH
ncbi:MAG: branched-chain amino acid ABC transporter permease [Betaproteobacteria bacterium]|jgi:branched-chain amino acid transport system permease protein|nr:branched-chain amino acid ABC transporter permease [Burkholderiales bacterium]MBT5950436.1 branched-chain amino acid ABC transporter permease [Betaproteobacteria bacterium]MBL6878790.1 branched-chain amino acid ABC transporter permease [Burkholderiales bacterium]MBT6411841.1 branched-chain amino acid ABC transporter permease [Betaproteobacteria bacterium]MCH1424336.1 branched-chain amino acid ABC transporter permease [Burkholderiales bacterium]